MYEEMLKRLREEASEWCVICCYRCGDNVCGAPDDRKKDCDIVSKLQAADAIEELSMKLHGDEAAIAGMKRQIERMVVTGKGGDGMSEHKDPCSICENWINGQDCENKNCPVYRLKEENKGLVTQISSLQKKIAKLESDAAWDRDIKYGNVHGMW